MLRELTIRQFAIIEEISLTFSNGFHVLTGETGAGKSILIDALGLVLGGRASSDLVRHGAEKAEIEALFEISSSHPVWSLLNEWGLEMEETLLLRREIAASGKSTCRINGRIVTLSMLRQIGKKLIDIHGQHEHQSLLDADEHVEWLDHFAGEEVLEVRHQYQTLFHEYQQVQKELARLNLDQQEVARRIDLLQFQKEEIRAAQLVEGEDVELEKERNRLAFAEKLLSNASQAYYYMYGENQGLDLIRKALSHMEEVLHLDERLAPVYEMMQSAYYQLEEGVHEIAKYRDELEFDPDRLNEVEERIYTIKQLKRKYGETISDILRYCQKVERELEELSQRDWIEEELSERKQQLEERLLQLADQLTFLRKKAASKLEKRVEQELADLNMGATVFHVAFYQPADRVPLFTLTGKDQIEFQIAPNPGEPLRPLARIASGGELSRIMLALKCIFTDMDQIHTLVFDEIDTGVSGRAAQAIAEKIAMVAKHHQVLCVTHLPQVACMADHHFYISKESDGYKTRTKVESLNKQGRTRELARMLGGAELTPTTHTHAEEMLCLAEEVKKSL
ncbi:DNA repair protein RecN [Thermoflavimicrobium dichotomicum]|nr:DNA repair protein RecN [Thermoflavimicrobium dichotomicum]